MTFFSNKNTLCSPDWDFIEKRGQLYIDQLEQHD